MTKLQSSQIEVPTLHVDGVAIVFAHWDDSLETEILPEEKALIQTSWSKKRSGQFILGRAAAHRALSMLDAPPTPILKGSDDAPLWPEPFTGSIAHCGDIGVAAVTHKGKIRSIGIDLEKVSEKPLKVLPRIAHAAEIDAVQKASNPSLAALKLFSVKEAAYKAFAPIVKRYIGFLEVHLIMESDHECSLVPLGTLAEVLHNAQIYIRTEHTTDHLLALVWLE